MPLRATWLVVSFALLACAPSRSARVLGRTAPSRQSAADGAVARAPFEPSHFHSVFRRAVRHLVQDGYEIVSCDPERGRVTTATRELDFPCGASSCLSRQSLTVVLGHRVARVTFALEQFDSATKGWELASGEPAQEEAHRIVGEITADEPPPAPFDFAPGQPKPLPFVAMIGAAREPCPGSAAADAPAEPALDVSQESDGELAAAPEPVPLKVASAR
jgi:hypothetical protein